MATAAGICCKSLNSLMPLGIAGSPVTPLPPAHKSISLGSNVLSRTSWEVIVRR
jgi:hypothetical protein